MKCIACGCDFEHVTDAGAINRLFALKVRALRLAVRREAHAVSAARRNVRWARYHVVATALEKAVRLGILGEGVR